MMSMDGIVASSAVIAMELDLSREVDLAMVQSSHAHHIIFLR